MAISNLKLNSYPITGIFIKAPYRSHIRAILDIPVEGLVRQAFEAHIRKSDPTPHMVLEWTEVDENSGVSREYRIHGRVLNTQFPQTKKALFEALT